MRRLFYVKGNFHYPEIAEAALKQMYPDCTITFGRKFDNPNEYYYVGANNEVMPATVVQVKHLLEIYGEELHPDYSKSEEFYAKLYKNLKNDLEEMVRLADDKKKMGEKVEFVKPKVFAIKRGNYPLPFMGMKFDAPAIFFKEKEEDDWDVYASNHDGAIIEQDLQYLLDHCEVEHFYKDSKFFEDDEQIDIDDIDLENELEELIKR